MSSQLSKRSAISELPVKWRASDAATEQGDKTAGAKHAPRTSDSVAEMEAFRRKLVGDATRDLLHLQGECDKLLADQLGLRERNQNELDTEVTGKAQENQSRNEDTLARLKREFGPESVKHKDAVARAEDANRALRKVKSDVAGRPLRTQFGLWYLPMMTLLAIAEVPVNRAAFELTFREEPIFSLLLAAAVGIVLIFFAHTIGIILRRWPERATLSQAALRLGAVGFLAVIAGFGVAFMARMRQGYIRLTSSEAESFGDRLQNALQGAVDPSSIAGGDTAMSVGDWTFIAVNLMLFVFGIVASFMRHDPHPDYERATRQSLRLDRTLASINARYAAKVSDENSRFEKQRRGIETHMSELTSSIAARTDQADAIRVHLARSREIAAQTISARCGYFAEGFNGAAPPGIRRMVAPTPRDIMGDLNAQGMHRAA